MAKFQVFKSNRAFMARFGIYSYHMTKPTNEFFTSIGSYYTNFFLWLCVITSSVVVYENISNLPLALENAQTIIGEAQSAGMFISMGLKLNKIKKLHVLLQDIIDKGEKISIANLN